MSGEFVTVNACLSFEEAWAAVDESWNELQKNNNYPVLTEEQERYYRAFYEAAFIDGAEWMAKWQVRAADDFAEKLRTLAEPAGTA